MSKLAESDQNLIFDIGIETLNAEYTKANWKAFRAAYPALYMMMCRDATLEEACKATQIAERTHNADRKTFNSVLHLWIGLLRAGRTEDIDYCQREAYVYLSEQRFCRLKQGMVIPRELVKLSHWD
ncbi:hypothetical protein QCE62_05530 [Caballeronia sp. LZ033]|uniref:hypothetical protein n=1 Tax=Caballeronia sp. LZ033 TaxID=3038566 RepID=UPI002862057E|nr:hypothetical protein [Caballeronia sp. LZ033]MDR5813050.1 hypothetical protein [Caballeronia sp. LZ033]